MTPRLIRSIYTAPCRVCGATQLKGVEVWYAKHYGVRCISCGPHGSSDPMIPAKRGSKRALGMSPSEPTPAADPTRESVSKPVPERMTVNVGALPATLCSDGVHRYEFGSIGDAVEDSLASHGTTESNRTMIDRKHRFNWGGYFYNYLSKETFLAELVQPNAKLLDAIEKMREEIVGELAMPTCRRRKIRHGQDDGEELDPDRVLARDPYAWDKSVRVEHTRRTVTIGCNISVLCDVKAEQLLYRGAAALALADILTERGFNVEIVAFKAVAGPSSEVRNGVIKYQVKPANMPLDLNTVAVGLCELAFARAVGVYGSARHWPGQIDGGLGYSCNLPAADREGLDYLIEQTCLSREVAVEWIKSQLKESEMANV